MPGRGQSAPGQLIRYQDAARADADLELNLGNCYAIADGAGVGARRVTGLRLRGCSPTEAHASATGAGAAFASSPPAPP